LMLMVLAGAIASQMRMTLQTTGEPVFVNVNVTTAPSSTKEMTRAATKTVEATLARAADGMVAWSSTVVGRQQIEHEMARVGSRYGQVNVGFIYEQEVLARVPALLEEIRTDLAKNPLIVGISIVSNEGGPPTGRAIDVRVRGRDIPEVNRVADALTDALRGRQGVKEIEAGIGPGLESWNLTVDPVEAARFGLNPVDVGRILRSAVAGIEASDLVLSERKVPIRVTFAGLVEPDIEEISDIPVPLPNGGTVRLRSLTKLTRVTMGRTLTRVDGQRAVRITANIDESVTSSEEEGAFVQSTFQELGQIGGDVSLFYGGAFADSEESFSSLPGAMLLALFLIYGVLAIQFKSYLQPVIIMAAIPLGIVGVVFGLSAFHMDLSFIAAIGSVGLVGIVVNDTLVLIDFANRARAGGLSARDAITQAAMTRLRPIIITTVTTVLGMLPLALGVAGREPMLEPMAVAISFGLMFATALALVVVPTLYLVVEDAAKLGRKQAQ
jgi:multidrug efflux pump subunit AcrB